MTQLKSRLTVKLRTAGTEEFVDKEVFMSAGLVRQLVAIAQAIDDISQLYVNPTLQDMMLVEMLKPRNARGQNDVQYTAADFEISTEDGNALIAWAIEHVTTFFIEAAQTIQAATMDNGAIKKLMDSLNGLATSAQKNQSVGSTTVNSVT